MAQIIELHPSQQPNPAPLDEITEGLVDTMNKLARIVALRVTEEQSRAVSKEVSRIMCEGAKK